MKKQMVLVADSTYGPGCANLQCLYTSSTDLKYLMRQFDEMRAYGDPDRDPWARRFINKWIDKSDLMEDDWWCCIEGKTFTRRLANFERKWYAVGLPRSLSWNDRIVVVSCRDDWADLVALVTLPTSLCNGWRNENDEKAIAREAIRLAYKQFEQQIPGKELGDAAAQVHAFHSGNYLEFGYNVVGNQLDIRG